MVATQCYGFSGKQIHILYVIDLIWLWSSTAQRWASNRSNSLT